MTFRVSEIVRSTGEHREQRGIEHYTFEGGKSLPKMCIASRSWPDRQGKEALFRSTAKDQP
jgi:hypothetical protein